MKKKSSIGLCEPDPQAPPILLPAARLAVAVLVVVLTLASLHAVAEDWTKFGHDLANTSRSAETGINSKNVALLQTKWKFAANHAISTTPAVATINGTPMLFVGSWDGLFHALNAVTGKPVWSFKVDGFGGACENKSCRIGSSPAVDTSQNLVFFGSGSTYLYALNAVSGTLVWKQSVGNNRQYEIWSSPAIYQGMVYIGVSAHGDSNCIPGGEVQAYDELNGNLVWSFNTIDQSTCPNGGTCVGGSVWSSVAIDDVNGIVYAGTGNPGSTCSPPTKNAGLYPDSILALSASTGTLLNYFQALKNDMRDRDFGASPVLLMTGETNQCTQHSAIDYWVSEDSKDGSVYIAERNANGLTGTVQKHEAAGDPSGFSATAAVQATETARNCSNEKKIIDYVNTIYVPGPGSFSVYHQDDSGKTTRLAKDSVTKPLYGAPASIQDIALFGGTDGNLYASGTTGKILAKFKVGSMWGGIAISGNRVYFGTVPGSIYCMSVHGK